jgi:hypothetical protein
VGLGHESHGFIIGVKIGHRNVFKRRHRADSFAWEAHHALRSARGYCPLGPNVLSEGWRRIGRPIHPHSCPHRMWCNYLDNCVDCGGLYHFLSPRVTFAICSRSPKTLPRLYEPKISTCRACSPIHVRRTSDADSTGTHLKSDSRYDFLSYQQLPEGLVRMYVATCFLANRGSYRVQAIAAEGIDQSRPMFATSRLTQDSALERFNGCNRTIPKGASRHFPCLRQW